MVSFGMSAPDVAAGRLRAQRHHGRERLRYPTKLLALIAVYYGAAQLVFALEVAGPVAAVVWLPVGIAVAFLYLGGLSLWPGLVIADLLVTNYDATPVGTALLQTCGNLLEVVVAVLLLRRLVPDGAPLRSIRALMGMLAALAAGAAASATVGSLAQVAGGVIGSGAVPTVWRTWWLGDFVGAMVLVPLALTWYRPPPRERWSGRVAEAGLLLIAVAVVAELVSRSNAPVTYLVFPLLILAALRFGEHGATVAVAVVVVVAVWNTAQYIGVFVDDSISDSVLATQLFIAVAALTTFCLAAVVGERELLGESLRASRARLVETSDTERRRIVRNLHDGAQQRLSALAVHLRLAADHPPPPAETAALISRAGGELSIAIEELRELAHGLPPALLTKLGLAGAIRSIAARASIPVTIVALPAVRLDDTAEATAYYVIAEAVTNAQRYAHASSIGVTCTVHHRVLEVTVVDDGVGGASEQMSSGLQGLRDRVEAIGGSFELESPRGRGTHVSATIPAMATRPSFSG
jgi:signal transduction histidine kinase